MRPRSKQKRQKKSQKVNEGISLETYVAIKNIDREENILFQKFFESKDLDEEPMTLTSWDLLYSEFLKAPRQA